MFILYALVIGLVVGRLLGGRLIALGQLRFSWGWLILGGLWVQVLLFSDPVTARIGSLGVPIYVVSTALVLGAILVNRRVPGMPIVAVGALANFLAITANDGYMPASPEAMAAIGMVPKDVYSNSSVVAHAALAPLTDIFALPAWLPWSNIFSVGDALIGVGIAVVIVVAMRTPVSAAIGASGQLPQSPTLAGTDESLAR